MAIVQYQFTVDDLARLPEDGSRYEMIDGALYVTAAPHSEHQAALDQIIVAVGNWYNTAGLGWPVSGAGVKLAVNVGVVPDLLWFSDERLPLATVNPQTGERDGKFHVAPDLAVEILSPGRENEERDRETKLTLYSRRGICEYWLVDRLLRTVEVDRLLRTVEVYRRDAAALTLAATLTPPDTLVSPLLPGFALPVGQIFRLPKALRP